MASNSCRSCSFVSTSSREAISLTWCAPANSGRSQLAEGWARALKGESVEPYSAGIAAGGVNPRAAKVMTEAGAPIDGQRSKKAEDVLHVLFDAVVTVCAEISSSFAISGKLKPLAMSCRISASRFVSVVVDASPVSFFTGSVWKRRSR